MKLLGLIGGTTWLSTVEYYSLLNKGVNKRLGGIEFPQLVLYSVNIGDIDRHNAADRMDLNIQMAVDKAHALKAAGVEGLLLCANTLHVAADRIEAEVGLPVVHIADATAGAIVAAGLSKVALLGTHFTMEGDFIRSRLAARGIEVLIPESREDRNRIHDPIFNELGKGIFLEETKATFLRIINDLASRGAQGVILGCTEFPLLLKPEEIPIPSFDTTQIHAAAGVEFILS